MSRDKSLMATSVLGRIKTAYGLRTDAQLAAHLGVKPNTIATWKKRGLLNYNLIFAKCHDVPPDYLVSGADPGWGIHVRSPKEPPHSINSELMSAVIERVEYLFNKEKLSLPPKKKAKLIILLYEELVEDESKRTVLDSKIISIATGLAA